MPLRRSRAWSFLTRQEDRVLSAHELIEAAIREHHEGVEEWYVDRRTELGSDASEDEHDHVDMLYAEQRSDSIYSYPQLLRASLFFSSFSVVERFMDLLCVEAQKAMGSTLSHKDLHGKGIRRARSYLVKVGEIDFPDTAHWHAIDGHGDLRNALIHAHGNVAGNPRLERLLQLESSVGTFRIAETRLSVELFQTFNPTFVAHWIALAAQLEERWPG